MEAKEHKQASLKKTKDWAAIFLAMAGLILFIYILGPIGLQAPMIKPVADFIEEHSINANGYYYTDVAEFSDAEMYMKNAMKFAPDSKK
jgi:hypothetical protein